MLSDYVCAYEYGVFIAWDTWQVVLLWYVFRSMLPWLTHQLIVLVIYQYNIYNDALACKTIFPEWKLWNYQAGTQVKASIAYLLHSPTLVIKQLV